MQLAGTSWLTEGLKPTLQAVDYCWEAFLISALLPELKPSAVLWGFGVQS